MSKFIFHYHQNGEKPSLITQTDWIFVFGSNLAGIHGAGAALEAVKNFGARRGVGYGQEGRSFAFPTKDNDIKTLALPVITRYSEIAVAYMSHRIINAHEKYWVTAVGTGLAGYSHADIAPLFAGLRSLDFGKLKPSDHISFPQEWMQYVEPETYHEFMLNNTLFTDSCDRPPEYMNNQR